MRVNVLLFAAYRDMAGIDALHLDVPDGVTVRQMLGTLRERDTAFSRLPPEPAVAVNRDWAVLDTPLSDGDEVALLPPIAGG